MHSGQVHLPASTTLAPSFYRNASQLRNCDKDYVFLCLPASTPLIQLSAYKERTNECCENILYDYFGVLHYNELVSH